MKKILFILSLAILIPFMGNSQNYVGVKSLYANHEETNDIESSGDRASWLAWFVQLDWYTSYALNLVPSHVGMFNRFEPADLTEYAGQSIQRLRYYWPYRAGDNVILILSNPHVQIYKGGFYAGDYYEPGTLVVDKEAPMPSNSTGWKTVVLDDPFLITGEEEICFGVIFYDYEDGYIIASTANAGSGYYNPDNYTPYKSDIMFLQDPNEPFGEMYSCTDVGGNMEGVSWLVGAYVLELTTCAAVTELNVKYSDDGKCNAELSWTAPLDNPNAKYNIYRKVNNADKLIKGNHPSTTYLDESGGASGFNPTEEQEWTVRAMCEPNGESPATSKKLSACATCDKPTELKAAYIGEDCTMAEIEWTAVPGAIEYEIYRNGGATPVGKTTDNRYTDVNNDGFNVATNKWEVVTVCEIGKSNPADISLTKCVGINEHVLSFSIVPNPASNEITIKSENYFNSIEVINFLGQTVITLPATEVETKVDVSHLSGGVYFVRIVSDNGTNVQKFVKK